MAGITTTKLAEELGVSKGRISQLVRAGKLDGCFTGDGRERRFDLAKSARVLQKKLDQGQMLGNGAATRQKLRQIEGEEDTAPRESGPLPPRDPDRYELARTQKAEEEARRLRRVNAEAEGAYLLARSVEREVARKMGQEIAEFETVMRDAASTIADKLGVEYREVRAILTTAWREHRTLRSEVLAKAAGDAGMSAEETAEDI